MRLYLARHGETVWNLEHRFQGWSDQPLSESGRQQARALALSLRGVDFDAAFSSDLQRALQTARIALGGREIEITPVEDLREMHLGELDGMPETEVVKRYPDLIHAWRRGDPGEVQMPGGGESLQAVRRRAWDAIEKIRVEHEGSDSTVLVVAHHTVNKVILSQALGIGHSHFRVLRQPPCALSVIDFDGDMTFVRAVNLNWIDGTGPQRYPGRELLERMRRCRAVVFDMDGVVLDSMPYYAAAWRCALAEQGVNPPEVELYRRESEDAGRSIEHFFAQAGRRADAETVGRIVGRVRELYSGFEHVGLRADARELLPRLRASGFRLALVTGSARADVERRLPAPIRDLFEAVICSEDVQRGKPDPMPFAAALEKLSLEPGRALAVENSPFGVRAARQAGLLTVALTSTLPAEELDVAEAVVPDLEQLGRWLAIE